MAIGGRVVRLMYIGSVVFYRWSRSGEVYLEMTILASSDATDSCGMEHPTWGRMSR